MLCLPANFACPHDQEAIFSWSAARPGKEHYTPQTERSAWHKKALHKLDSSSSVCAEQAGPMRPMRPMRPMCAHH